MLTRRAPGHSLIPQAILGPSMSDPMAVSRKLVAVFAADVEGYSRLMGTDEVSLNLLSMTTSTLQHAENHMLLLRVRPLWRELPRSCMKWTSD